MRQLRGGVENQEDEEMKILTTSNKKTIKNYTYNSKLYVFLGQLGLINRGGGPTIGGVGPV